MAASTSSGASWMRGDAAGIAWSPRWFGEIRSAGGAPLQWRAPSKLPLPQHRQGAGDQRNEAHGHQRVALQTAFTFHDALDDLSRGIAADRHDQDAADGELVDQRLRALFGGG